MAAGSATSAPREAEAQQVADPARVAFERGTEALHAGRHADAARAFEQSHRLRPVPIVSYNLGLALRALGRNREAAEVFERFLRAPGANVEPARMEAVQRERDTMLASLAQVQITLDPGSATVLVDGRTTAVAGGVLAMDPGRHTVEFRADGRLTQRREEEFAPGARLRWTVMLASVPTSAVEPTGAAVARSAPVGPIRVADDGRDRLRVGMPTRGATDAAATGSVRPSRTWVVPVAIVGSVLLAAGVGVGIWALTREPTVDAPPTTTGWVVESIVTR